ncbi:hypothetical protein JB92DRAFT_2982724, partial [Gautieria morchelliformis]
MSPLQVNLSSKEIATAYQPVLDGTDIDWMPGSNGLKVRPLGWLGRDTIRVKIPRYVPCPGGS